MAAMYMAASKALKTTEPRARPASVCFRTPYNETAMAALPKAAMR